MTGTTAETEIFEQHRRQLTGVAYRITGSWTDAEDIAQDVWLRWANVHQDVDRPRNWLLRVTVRASLDRLRRLKRRRETYLGPWLPEPVSLAPDPEDTAELRDTLMVGMLLVLESLSPLERAVFVLREAFDWDYEDIAEALSRSPAAVRQLAHRANQHVEEARPRFTVDERRAAESTERFLRACLDGNVVLSFLAGLGRKKALADATHTLGHVNTRPGIITSIGGQVQSAMTFDHDRSGRIVAIYVVSAPSKLAHVSAPAADPGDGR
jgi:RNA polymerase sigma factor (sigma-70 family)